MAEQYKVVYKKWKVTYQGPSNRAKSELLTDDELKRFIEIAVINNKDVTFFNIELMS